LAGIGWDWLGLAGIGLEKNDKLSTESWEMSINIQELLEKYAIF
jgi:hypothetical protein